MKRVAIVGADFVPSSLPQALRIRFFARHLPEFGWRPTVITTDPQFYECDVEYENERLLPEGLEVVRTRALPVKLTRKLGMGDVGMRSIYHHWRALAHLCRHRLIDLVFIPVPPYVPMILGRLIRERFGIPYVIDYNDPWVTEYYWKLPKSQRPPKWAFAYSMARLLEPFALRRVSYIVGVSKGTTDAVKARYPWLRDTEAAEIPHGGEPLDFEYLRSSPRPQKVFDPSDSLIHLSYVGACVQPMFESVRALFSAVRRGLNERPNLFARLRLHFVGTSYSHHATRLHAIMPLAREQGLQDVVTEHPARVAYLDALQILLDSHALVALGSEEPHYTASKIFPYILAKRPLLAVFHEDSTVVRILRETKAGAVVTFGPGRPASACIEDILSHLENILLLPDGYEPATSWEAFEAYTTRTMAGKLADVFRQTLQRSELESCRSSPTYSSLP